MIFFYIKTKETHLSTIDVISDISETQAIVEMAHSLVDPLLGCHQLDKVEYV